MFAGIAFAKHSLVQGGILQQNEREEACKNEH